MKLHDWFRYSDKDNSVYNPVSNTMITIDRFWQHEEGELNSPDWRKEEWLIHCALIPIEQLNAAAIEIASPNYLTFEPGWNFEDEFSFGDFYKYNGIQLYSLVSAIKHPVNQEFIVDLNHKFVVYHGLEKRSQNNYFHPLDNIIVGEVNIDSHTIYDPTPRVNIHRDYLRDFLAAMRMGLLISVEADRFANASTEEALELEVVKDSQIDEFTWLSTSIHTPTHHGCFRGHSIFRRNFIIPPYDKPKFERSPWYYFGEQATEEPVMPSFIVNDEGKRQALPQNTYLGNYIQNGIGSCGYLWFRPEVLKRYLQDSKYSVFFHMRNWGIASVPGSKGTIDVGINSQGLVNAFAPNIANLPFSEQAYWASYSSLPSGEICEEMYETRMQQNPPHSPGVVELIRDARTQLSKVFKSKFSMNLFKDIEPSQQELCKLSVGPISNEYTEVNELSKILYGWLIETMQITPLRNVISALGGTVDERLRQIKLLEKSLIAKGLSEIEARSMTAPIVGLNDLRIGAAHIGSPELGPIFQLMGASSIPESPRAAWHLCVDSITLCLNKISVTLET